MLWHQRMDHIGEKGLQTLQNKNLIDGLTYYTLVFDLYEHCIYKKQSHVQLYSSSHKSYGLLDLVHLDVFGHVKVPLISKSLYYVAFIDDYSRRTWICFLESKSKVFCRFKEFKVVLENHIDRKIKTLRTDNGGEFCSIECDKLYKENDIERHKKTPYTP